ncbi:hypothetical protein M9Y10_028362 [Tritrichomonas musculus]|uniref:Uncharacterized protein n=1 Tax=Tritrichomonas musculus TaxID=1915356 RepID=A0ABR2KK65_9EUKA
MEIDFKCYKVNFNSDKKTVVQNSDTDFQEYSKIPERKYKVIEMYHKNDRPIFLVKNLETGNTKEFDYIDVLHFFYFEYLDFMRLESKSKKKSS